MHPPDRRVDWSLPVRHIVADEVMREYRQLPFADPGTAFGAGGHHWSLEWMDSDTVQAVHRPPPCGLGGNGPDAVIVTSSLTSM
jgi:hypothetical protein